MNRLIFIIFLLLSSILVQGQELNCRIQVVSQQIQGSNRQVFDAMQKAIFEFMNNHRWTNHVFSVDERIECNIMINLSKQISSDEYSGTITVQASRPVYNTTYNSTLFNYIDNNFQVKFVENQVLEFNETSHGSNLTAILAFYAYIVIGLDYDSFGMDGGSDYFQKAEKIVSNAQNEPTKGWKSYEDRKNRYWMVENLLNDTYGPIRECFYRMHRLGLDRMSEKPTEGRSEIADALQGLQAVYRKKPGSFLMQLFFDAKRDEIMNVFSESFPEEKRRVYMVLKEVDPANASKYEKLIKTN